MKKRSVNIIIKEILNRHKNAMRDALLEIPKWVLEEILFEIETKKNISYAKDILLNTKNITKEVEEIKRKYNL